MNNRMRNSNFTNTINVGLYSGKKIILILAMGFEDRNIAIIEKIKTASLSIKKIILLDYKNKNANEPMRSDIIKKSNIISKSIEIIETNELSKIENHLKDNDKVIIDISGMTRIIIFQVLNILDRMGIFYDIVYTEAETYFPLKSFYDSLTADGVNKETAFSRYLESEKAEFAYSYDCDIISPDELSGKPEPGKPAMIISFFTFKRSRLQAILQLLEVEKKIFILSEPVRPELKWRRHFMEIANLDLIQKNEPDIKILNTLNPFDVMHYLEEKTYKNKDYSRYNLILAPLGSKMQTIGSYFYWRKHPEITVLFSQPRSYFKDAYSKSYKETFIVTSEIIKENLKC